VDDDHPGHDPKRVSAAFGWRLRKLRHRRQLSQDALAQAADIHSTAIGRMERGAREPRLSTILRLAEALDIQPGELLDDLGKMQTSRPKGS